MLKIRFNLSNLLFLLTLCLHLPNIAQKISHETRVANITDNTLLKSHPRINGTDSSSIRPILVRSAKFIYDPAVEVDVKRILLDNEDIAKKGWQYFYHKGEVWIILDSLEYLKQNQKYYAMTLVGNAKRACLYYLSQDHVLNKVERGLETNQNTFVGSIYPTFDLDEVDLDYPIALQLEGPVLPVILFQESVQAQEIQYLQLIIVSLILGGLIFILIVNVSRWIISKTMIYALYSLYLVFFVLNILAYGGNNLLFFFTPIAPYTKYILHVSVIFAAIIMAAWYGIVFLRLKATNLLFYRIIIGFLTGFIILFSYSLFFPATPLFTNISFLLLLIVLVSAGISQWRKGHKYVSFYVAAYGTFVIIQLSYTWLRTIDPTFPYVSPVPIYFIGIFIEALLLNISLNYRIDFEKKRAEDERQEIQKTLIKYQKEQNARLEEKVSARTLELLTKTTELEENNEELTRIEKELKTANSEVRKRNKELNQTVENLKKTQGQLVESEKMASLGILSAGIGHEINNPLNFIKGGIDGLSLQLQNHNLQGDQDTEKYIHAVSEGVNRATSIVSSLAHFSREGAQMDEACDIHKIIDNCLVILQSPLKHRIKIIKDYNEEECIIPGNEGRLHQAFLNILINAGQAIMETGTITIGTQKKKNKIEVSISDTGKGIKKENLAKIMDPFFTTKRPGEGTGLGLSITYRIIEEHHGTIEVVSKVGNGSTFLITFRQ